MRTSLAFPLLLAAARLAAAQPGTLMPVPRSLQLGEGGLSLDSATTIAISAFRNDRLAAAVRRFTRRLEARIGSPVTGLAASPARIDVEVRAAGQAVQDTREDESYRLEVAPSGARLSAPTVVGAIRGLETLLQLVASDSIAFHVPAVTVDDAPRFPWRGLLVDVSRHFMPVDQVKRTLDAMAMVKLNVLHWHLSDDQGFRVESKRYPRLHRMGSDGEYYTQDQLRELVAYARDRGIRVLPEFDMPGHSTSWFAGYPRYTTRPGPIEIRRAWGGADAIFDPTREEVYTFIDGFIGEMARVFPDPYWHIGGDEVESKHWQASRRIMAWGRARGLRTTEALQSYFNRRLTRILARHGKRMVGWDEILHPNLPRQTVVQSWRGVEYLGRATGSGYASILSAPYYLDHIKPATDFYLADPVPDSLAADSRLQRLVLGGEACMWSEFVSAETTDSRIWPRLGAVAERFWSPRDVRDVADMYRRLDVLSGRLEGIGVRARSHSVRVLRQLMPAGDVAPLESLFTAVQPPFFGQRLGGVGTDQLQPLTRIVDASRPDPSGRWKTERLSRLVIREPGNLAARDSLAALFAMWRDNTPRVSSLASLSPLLSQAVPAAKALERTSLIGLEVLRHVAAGTRPTDEWVQLALTELKGYDNPQGLLRVAIVPEVRALVSLYLRVM